LIFAINPLMGTLSNGRTTIQQYGDWYTCCWWVGCYIWYSGPAQSPLRFTKCNINGQCIPTSYQSMW